MGLEASEGPKKELSRGNKDVLRFDFALRLTFAMCLMVSLLESRLEGVGLRSVLDRLLVAERMFCATEVGRRLSGPCC